MIRVCYDTGRVVIVEIPSDERELVAYLDIVSDLDVRRLLGIVLVEVVTYA